MDKSAFFAAIRKRGSGVFGASLSQKQVEGIDAVLNEAETRRTPLKWLAYMLASTRRHRHSNLGRHYYD